MKKIIILFMGISLEIFGQQQVSTSLQFPPATPEFKNTGETNLLKDVSEARVNYSTGTAIIDLPIYNINSGGITLPVSLNYAASGIKVDNEASWVGLGWVLNAGAYISREIKGRPDDLYYLTSGTTSGMTNQQWIQMWLNDCQNILNMPMYSPNAIFPQPNTYGNFFYFFSKSAEKLVPCASQHGPSRDIQPDLYTVNLNGKKIEFIFDLNQKPIILNDDGAYKIQFDLYNFTIIDESGTKFFFKSTDAEKIRPNVTGSTHYYSNTSNLTYFDFNYPGGYNTTGCTTDQAFGLSVVPKIKWNLTKIESPDGKYMIDLEYDNYAHYQFNVSFVYNIDKTNNQQYMYTYNDRVYPWESQAYQHGTSVQVSFNCYYAKRLKKISWHDGYMTFEAGPVRDDVFPKTTGTTILPINDDRSLSKIKIFDKNNVEQHRFGFDYSYFNSTINTIDGMTYRSKRLKLLSLTEYSSNLTAKPPYLFEYDNTALPVRFSFEKDFWGYYKVTGATHMQGTNYYYANYSNTNLNDFALWSQFCIYSISLPGSGTPVTVTGIDRLPNLANTQACVLKKITYPLKGYQEFEYELNTFCIDNDLVNRNAGGLRIKKITTSDGINFSKDRIKNFYYDYESVFLSGSVKRNSGEINFLPVFGRDANDVYNQSIFSNYKIHSENYATSVNASNSQVFYREVKVEEPGKGSTIYKFDNAGTFGHNKDIYSGSTFLIEKGKTDIVHGENALTYPDRNDVLLKRVNYPYSPEPNTDWGNGTIREMQQRDQANNIIYKKVFNYQIKSASKFKSFDLTYFVKGAQSYMGTPHLSFAVVPYYYLSIWRVMDSETEYLYNPVYPNSLSNAQVKTINYSYTSSDHKFLTAKTTTESDGRVITEKYKYVADFSAANPTSLVPDVPSLAILNMRYKTNQLKNPVEETITQTKGSVTEILSGSFYKYKDLANTATGAGQSNNTPVVRDHETYLLETGSPLAASLFNSCALNLNGSNASLSFSNYFKRKLTNLNYDTKGNLLQSMAENGPPNSALYGYNNSIPIAEVANARYSEIAYTSFESEEIANWWHNPASIISSGAKTGDKCYDFGTAAPGTTHYDLILDKQISDLDQNGKYIFSCWIKTPHNYVNNSAGITIHSTDGITPSVLYPNLASSYFNIGITKTYNKWVYFSTVIDLKKVRADAGMQAYPAGPAFGLRTFLLNNSTTVHFYVDDIRIRPYNSFMTTITAKPLIGVTSKTDHRNVTETYEYDAFGRPKILRDLNNNIIEKTSYHYRGSSCAGCQ